MPMNVNASAERRSVNSGAKRGATASSASDMKVAISWSPAQAAGKAGKPGSNSHFEQERAMVLDVVGEYLGEFIARERKKREEMRDEIRELRVQCARLGSESAELRVQLAQLAVDRSSKVVDLPSPLSSRRVVN